MRRSSRRTSKQPLHSSQEPTVRQSQNRRAKRTRKLAELLKNTSAIENGLKLPDEPARYLALEQSASGDTLWAYFGDLMTGIMQQLEVSETRFVDRIRVHDLDTGLVYAPQWTIESLYEIPH
jgi:hypothetical protein